MWIRRVATVMVVAFSLIGTTAISGASAASVVGNMTDPSQSAEPSDAKATPPEGGRELTPEEAARQAAHMPYMALSEEVWRISEASQTGQAVSGRFEVRSNRYIVNWYGDVPASLTELVGRAAEQGIEVDVRPSPHSRTELMEAAKELTRSVPDPLGMSVTLAPDGSGLSVSWPALEGQDNTTSRQALQDAVERTRARGIIVVYDTTKPRAVDAGREADNRARQDWAGATFNDAQSGAEPV